jgi:hypothetical protein
MDLGLQNGNRCGNRCGNTNGNRSGKKQKKAICRLTRSKTGPEILLQFVRYIHRNPVRAGITDRPDLLPVGNSNLGYLSSASVWDRQLPNRVMKKDWNSHIWAKNRIGVTPAKAGVQCFVL